MVTEDQMRALFRFWKIDGVGALLIVISVLLYYFVIAEWWAWVPAFVGLTLILVTGTVYFFSQAWKAHRSWERKGN